MSLQLKRAVRPIRKPNFECLEDRKLMAALIPGVTLDPLLVPKFVNPLPQLLAPNSVYQPTGTIQATLQDSTIATVPLYTVGAYQTSQSLGPGNAYFYEQGLLRLTVAHAQACQSCFR